MENKNLDLHGRQASGMKESWACTFSPAFLYIEDTDNFLGIKSISKKMEPL